MGDGELTRLLSETDSVNSLPVPAAILLGSASFWNELEAVSHYVGKQGVRRSKQMTIGSKMEHQDQNYKAL